MKRAVDALSCVLWIAAAALACALALRTGVPETRLSAILGVALTSGLVVGASAFAYLRYEYARWTSSESTGGEVFLYSLTRPWGYFLSISFGVVLASVLAACFPAGLRGEGPGVPGLFALVVLVATFVGYPLYVGFTVRGFALRVGDDAVELASRKKSVIRIPWDELEAAIVEGRQAILLVGAGGRRLVLNGADRRFAWHVDGFETLLDVVLARAAGKVTEVSDLTKAAAERKR